MVWGFLHQCDQPNPAELIRPGLINGAKNKAKHSKALPGNSQNQEEEKSHSRSRVQVLNTL